MHALAPLDWNTEEASVMAIQQNQVFGLLRNKNGDVFFLTLAYMMKVK